MGTAAPDTPLGRRGRSAVGLALVASGAVGISALVAYFVGAPIDWLYMLALGVASVPVPGAVFIVPLCGALLALVDRPWRRRAGWASVAYRAFVVAWVMSVIAGVPWSKNASDTFLLPASTPYYRSIVRSSRVHRHWGHPAADEGRSGRHRGS